MSRSGESLSSVGARGLHYERGQARLYARKQEPMRCRAHVHHVAFGILALLRHRLGNAVARWGDPLPGISCPPLRHSRTYKGHDLRSCRGTVAVYFADITTPQLLASLHTTTGVL